jgi:hypothetical protein
LPSADLATAMAARASVERSVNEVDLSDGLGKLAGVEHGPTSPKVRQFKKIR